MFGWIGELLKPVTEIGKQYMQNKAEKNQASHELEIAILQHKAALALSEQSHNNAKELKTLEVASPMVRWIIVGHVMVLMDSAIFYPEAAARTFKQLGEMPEWVIGLFVTVFGFYFAVTKLTETGADMIAAWKGDKK